MNNKPILKSNKKFCRKILSGVIIVGLAIGSLFSFAGCKINCNPPEIPEKPPVSSVLPGEAEKPGQNPPIEKPITPEVNITFEEFMEKHSDLALAFASDYVKEELLDNKTPLSQTWGFHANDEEELDSISLTYTYASDDTTRIVEIANATFIEPVDLDTIVANEVTTDQTTHQITRETSFEFNAKWTYENSQLSETLCDFVSSDAKYISEVESSREGTRQFKIAEETSSAINVYNLLAAGTTDEEIVSSLDISYNYILSQQATYPLGDKGSMTIETENYELEEFAPENVEEIVKDWTAEITSALDTHFLEKAGKACYTRYFDQSLLTKVQWDIGDGETISEIKFISTYTKSEGDERFSVAKITLSSPINIKELTKETLDNVFSSSAESATFTQEYYFAYDPAIQGTRDELVNAIFEAHGMDKECPEGAVRYFIDQGYTIDTELSSEARQFKVVEITNTGVKEFSIMIKNSSSDEEYIEKLQKPENYRIYNEKSCTMTGKKVTGTIEETDASEQSDFESIEETIM